MALISTMTASSSRSRPRRGRGLTQFVAWGWVLVGLSAATKHGKRQRRLQAVLAPNVFSPPPPPLDPLPPAPPPDPLNGIPPPPPPDPMAPGPDLPVVPPSPTAASTGAGKKVIMVPSGVGTVKAMPLDGDAATPPKSVVPPPPKQKMPTSGKKAPTMPVGKKCARSPSPVFVAPRAIPPPPMECDETPTVSPAPTATPVVPVLGERPTLVTPSKPTESAPSTGGFGNGTPSTGGGSGGPGIDMPSYTTGDSVDDGGTPTSGGGGSVGSPSSGGNSGGHGDGGGGSGRPPSVDGGGVAPSPTAGDGGGNDGPVVSPTANANPTPTTGGGPPSTPTDPSPTVAGGGGGGGGDTNNTGGSNVPAAGSNSTPTIAPSVSSMPTDVLLPIEPSPTEVCDAISDGTAPTLDPSVVLTVKMKIQHTHKDSDTMIALLQDFFDNLRTRVAGCSSLRSRRRLQAAYITNVVFDVEEDVLYSSNCGYEELPGLCLGVAAGTLIFHNGGNTTGMAQWLYNTIVLRCADIKALSGVVDTFEPCPYIVVIDGDEGGGGGGGIVGIATAQQKSGFGAGAAMGVVAAGLITVLLLMLLAKQSRKDEDNQLKHLVLEDDESDTWMDDQATDNEERKRSVIIGEDDASGKSPHGTMTNSADLSGDIYTLPGSDNDIPAQLRQIRRVKSEGSDVDEYGGYRTIRRIKSDDSSLAGRSETSLDIARRKLRLPDDESDDGVDRWYFTGGKRAHKFESRQQSTPRPYYMAQGQLEYLHDHHVGHDVHLCSSATCELCELRRSEGTSGLQFVPTRPPRRAPSLPFDAARNYVSEDTVQF